METEAHNREKTQEGIGKENDSLRKTPHNRRGVKGVSKETLDEIIADNEVKEEAVDNQDASEVLDNVGKDTDLPKVDHSKKPRARKRKRKRKRKTRSHDMKDTETTSIPKEILIVCGFACLLLLVAVVLVFYQGDETSPTSKNKTTTNVTEPTTLQTTTLTTLTTTTSTMVVTSTLTTTTTITATVITTTTTTTTITTANDRTFWFSEQPLNLSFAQTKCASLAMTLFELQSHEQVEKLFLEAGEKFWIGITLGYNKDNESM